jgi:hypothetical protein
MEVFDFLKTMSGPEFLALYFVWFALLYGAVYLLRRWGFDTRFTTYACLIPFEALGVARYILGSQHGLKNWTGLGIMMIFGFLAFSLRRGDSNGQKGWYFEGGNCGGDGGCGGGGCGGCGGD